MTDSLDRQAPSLSQKLVPRYSIPAITTEKVLGCKQRMVPRGEACTSWVAGQ